MDGRANHGRIGARVGSTRRAAERIVPWGLSLTFHASIAVAAAMVAMTVAPARPVPVAAAGTILGAQPAERIAATPRAYEGGIGGGGVQSSPAAAWGEAGRQAARAVERVRGAPAVGSRLDLAGLDSVCGAVGVFGAAFGAAPRSSLLGAGGNAHHVVYLIDRSGSMIGVFEDVRREVLLSIGRLGEDQDFHIILFAQGRAIENVPCRLVPPTEANKLQAAEFLAGARAGLQSDPIPALRRAFEVLEGASDGKLIYLLSDGVFPNGPAVMATIHTRNKNKDVHIHTYFCGGDASAAGMLQEIARATGGLFRQVGGQAAGP
ncbi:MAG: hypothetical protein MUP47_09155 [Phycisphaerae bacterium]|nr:hypothetical protein [Phycisphaerae bacterium]